MNRIDDLRKVKGLTYKDIAEKANVTSMYVCQLAKGKRQNPSLAVMQNVSAALGEKVERVFKVNS